MVLSETDNGGLRKCARDGRWHRHCGGGCGGDGICCVVSHRVVEAWRACDEVMVEEVEGKDTMAVNKVITSGFTKAL